MASKSQSSTSEQAPVYIVDGARTPFLKARGKPGPFTPIDLAVQCGRPLLMRQSIPPEAFDQVILGCVNVISEEMNPARVAALRLGMGTAMPAFTVQINCGSGMQSIDTAFKYIRDGRSDLILAGGTEALSHSPQWLRKKVDNGDLGRKSGKGLYHWKDGKPDKKDNTRAAPEDTRDRLILPMLNACVACLREAVITDADVLDGAMIFGTGFAPFRGGPIHYARQRGYDDINSRLESLATQYGDRFKPDEGWKQTSDAN